MRIRHPLATFLVPCLVMSLLIGGSVGYLVHRIDSGHEERMAAMDAEIRAIDASVRKMFAEQASAPQR